MTNDEYDVFKEKLNHLYSINILDSNEILNITMSEFLSRITNEVYQLIETSYVCFEYYIDDELKDRVKLGKKIAGSTEDAVGFMVDSRRQVTIHYYRSPNFHNDVFLKILVNHLKSLIISFVRHEDSLEMFEGFVKAVMKALDQKSKHTALHCKRVPEIAVGIAELINGDNTIFKDEFFTRADLHELEIAAWLHDIGKVAVKDSVLEKSKRLEFFDNSEQFIIDRLKLFVDQKGHYPDWFDSLVLAIQKSNSGQNLSETEIMLVKKCSKLSYFSLNGEQPLLRKKEIDALTLQRGTLTRDERDNMEAHATMGINILNEIKFPSFLSNVREYAIHHHERYDGGGYPEGLRASTLKLGSRVMSVADVYEALSAERPYKKPLSKEEVFKIMLNMSSTGHLDPDIVALVIDKGLIELESCEKKFLENAAGQKAS